MFGFAVTIFTGVVIHRRNEYWGQGIPCVPGNIYGEASEAFSWGIRFSSIKLIDYELGISIA